MVTQCCHGNTVCDFVFSVCTQEQHKMLETEAKNRKADSEIHCENMRKEEVGHNFPILLGTLKSMTTVNWAVFARLKCIKLSFLREVGICKLMWIKVV